MSDKLQFQCRFCPKVRPHFKGLVDHYKAKHADKVKRYEIRHKPNRDSALIYATSEGEACQMVGWSPAECVIREMPQWGA